VKVAVLGGGGFRTPMLYRSLVSVAHDAGIDEIVLLDPSELRLGHIAAVIRAMDDEGDPRVRVGTTTRLEEALEGSGAVLAAIRVGGAEGRVIDETVPLGLGVLGQETVGPGGICFALRTIPQMRRIAEAVAARAPDAWFLNFTNPAGLVTEAIREFLGDRGVGICDSATSLCDHVAAALGRPRAALVFDYAGLNHLGWLLAVRDADGRDLLPGLLSDERRLLGIEEARLFGAGRLRELRMVPNDYLVYYERTHELVRALHARGRTRGQVIAAQQREFYEAATATPVEALASWRASRDARNATYMAEAWEATAVGPDISAAGDDGYGGVAAAFLRAATTDADETLILDVANLGRLPFLDDAAVIEVPCAVGPRGVTPLEVGELPGPQRELVARVKEVEHLTLRAAVEGSAALAVDAIASHPVVGSRELAERILAGYLARHPGLSERLS
jgi:6-phospho-beta-glucosidase